MAEETVSVCAENASEKQTDMPNAGTDGHAKKAVQLPLRRSARLNGGLEMAGEVLE